MSTGPTAPTAARGPLEGMLDALAEALRHGRAALARHDGGCDCDHCEDLRCLLHLLDMFDGVLLSTGRVSTGWLLAHHRRQAEARAAEGDAVQPAGEQDCSPVPDRTPAPLTGPDGKPYPPAPPDPPLARRLLVAAWLAEGVAGDLAEALERHRHERDEYGGCQGCFFLQDARDALVFLDRVANPLEGELCDTDALRDALGQLQDRLEELVPDGGEGDGAGVGGRAGPAAEAPALPPPENPFYGRRP